MNGPIKILSPEEKLLISLCGLEFTGQQIIVIREYIRQVTDWNYFVKLANEHGIIALAGYNIKLIGLEKEIPRQAMSVLENGYMQSLVRNTWLTERWKEVNTILTKAGMKHILLKGMALEHTIYGAKGLRQMSDNDILLRSDDALNAWHLLQHAGFSNELIKSPLHRKIIPDIGKHLPTLFKQGYAVEIHHRLFDNETKDNSGLYDLFAGAVEIQVGETKALMLASDIHLMFLVSHFERHALSGHCQLRLYTDIVLLDKTNTVRFPDSFISNPKQEKNPRFRKAAYKENIKSVPAKIRMRFIVGDIFPSLKWMKKRYNCSGFKALLFYPVRVGKLRWLL